MTCFDRSSRGTSECFSLRHKDIWHSVDHGALTHSCPPPEAQKVDVQTAIDEMGFSFLPVPED